MAESIRNVMMRALVASAAAFALTACSGSGSSSSTTTTTSVSSLTGSYVFQVAGTDPTDGDYAAVGSFVADGKGNITSGVADYNLGSGVDTSVPLKGTYIVSGTNVIVTLTDGAKVTDTINATLPAAGGSATIGGFDGTGTGTLYSQVTSGFTPVGAYTFTVKGEQNYTVTGSGAVVVGPGNTFTGGNLSYSDGTNTTAYTSPSGFLYPPNAAGRGQGAIAGINLSYYVIGPKQIEMIGIDPRALLLLPATKM